MKKRIILIGGLGFIGKNLYNHLQAEHDVWILTDKIGESDDGFITQAVREKMVIGTILDQPFVEQQLRDFDVVFSLAGSSGAADSILNPYKDLDTNLKGHLNVLEACRKNCPRALMVFPSSRLVYGKPLSNPVNEKHPLHPESIYAIHKITTEHYYQLYQRLFGLKCIIFRISNPFGPYQQFGSNHYGILNWFIHNAITEKRIEIYGDGSQQRDFISIQDLVKLFSLSMENQRMYGKIFNIGGGIGISLRQAAETIIKYIPDTRMVFKPWPEIDEKIETGNYVSDLSLLQEYIDWKPAIQFEKEVRDTISFYDR